MLFMKYCEDKSNYDLQKRVLKLKKIHNLEPVENPNIEQAFLKNETKVSQKKNINF